MQYNKNDVMVSVIIPSYNVGSTIERCINSVISQTHTNLEIIIIDDGSVDDTGKIADKFSDKDSRVYVIHKKNEGLGMARNTGLSAASGKYVFFVDPDDDIDNSIIDYLLVKALKYDADYCKSGFIYIDSRGTVEYSSDYMEAYYEGEAVLKALFPKFLGSIPEKHDSVDTSVCASLYKLRIIKEKKLLFCSEREYIFEDMMFNLKYLQCINSAYICKENKYYYYYNSISLMHKYRHDRWDACKLMYDKVVEIINLVNNDKECYYRIKKLFFIWTRGCILQERKRISGYSIHVGIKHIRSICSDELLINIIKDYPYNRLAIKQRIFVLLIKMKMAFLLYCFS